MLVHLLAGEGPLFGTGHRTRMEEFKRFLEKRGVSVRMHRGTVDFRLTSVPPVAEIFPRLPGSPRDDSLLVLDLRDIDPRPFLKLGPVIALDNRHRLRSRLLHRPDLVFHDTIPHPDLPLQLALRQCLLAIDRFPEPRSDIRREGRILIYGGSDSRATDLDPFFLSLLEQKKAREVLRIGGPPPAAKGRGTFRYHPRLGRRAFLNQMAGSRYFFSYFGISILEAWHLGCLPVLVGVQSPDHDRLSRYLSREAGLFYWRPGKNDGSLRRWLEGHSDRPLGKIRPGEKGMELLAVRLEELGGKRGLL